MVFASRKFEVEVERRVDVAGMAWPEEEAACETSLCGNLGYTDLRGITWDEAVEARCLEGKLIDRIVAAEDPEEELVVIVDELYEDDVGLYGLDIGVAAAVAGLSAAGCVPCCSCNGGAFGGYHREEYPLVVFFARRALMELLLDCAVEAGTGLENGHGGSLMVYADDIQKIREFGRVLIEWRSLFEALTGPSKA